ncbi:hypothetical protein Taro_056820 [Colocasia esculenta]|uniref:Metallo-beta-lactamase domain-containing protein n=1 Tax=Colocasia esculenta TaxID=4460 RepID=A0A843XXN1_COLES|nr:hypothetical protein [Colocasia esculenta]
MAAHCCFSPSNRHNRFPFPCRSGRGSTTLSPPIAALSFVPRSPPPARSRLCRMRRKLRALSSSGENSSAPVISGKPPVQSNPVVRLTYLEGNSWLWDVEGLNILVDPVLVGNLDFGIPWLYSAAKKTLKKLRLEDLPEVDCLLITQSLDDHCHVNTLRPLSKMRPDLWVIATPNAESILNPMFRNVTYLEPGQSSELEGGNGTKLIIRATAGPVLGPPWQRPENGYIIAFGENHGILYYEPHCVYNQSLVQNFQADIIITPVIRQLLPFFTLVSGQEDAVNLGKLLQAKFIVAMQNGDLDSNGILTNIIKTDGTVESFKVTLWWMLEIIQ